MRNTTSIQFDKEFLSTVRYYMPEEERNLIPKILQNLANFEDGKIKESLNVLRFKRNVLARLAVGQRRYFRTINSSEIEVAPWYIDDCVLFSVSLICQLIREEEAWFPENMSITNKEVSAYSHRELTVGVRA